MSELEQLPPEIRDLFAEERKAYVEDEAARARVLRRIEASIAFATVGVGIGAAATAGAAAKMGLFARLGAHLSKYAKLWIGLSLVGGIAVGETHARLSGASSVAPPPPPPATTVGRIPPPPAPNATTAEESSAVPVGALPSAKVGTAGSGPGSAGSGSATAGAPPPSASSTLAAEQALIDRARAALARGRSADALAAADEHARQFSRGSLAEERETIAIQSLLVAGRRGEADARRKRFHARYPQSLYGGAVDALFSGDGGR